MQQHQLGDNSPVLQISQGVASLVDTRDNEFVQKLTSQLADKDALIRKLQQQVDDFSRQRLARLQTATEAEKGGSAGPNKKTELAKIKKQLREKEKEIIKLRNENTASQAKKENEED